MKPEWEKAARSGDVAAMQQILESNATPTKNIVNSKDRHGQTALMLAALRGHTPVVDLLIAAGAELNHTAKFNLTALMLAVINDDPSIASLLVKAGADTAIKGTGAPGFHQKTALDLATVRNNAAVLELLNQSRDT